MKQRRRKNKNEETIVAIAMALQPDDYEFTVNVNGTRHDVYRFKVKQTGKEGQLSVAIIGDKAVVAMIRAGRGTPEEAEKHIAESMNKEGSTFLQ